MNKFLNAVVARLPRKLRRYAKALVPLLAGVAVAGQDLVFDAAEVDELKALAGAALLALVVAAVPNQDG